MPDQRPRVPELTVEVMRRLAEAQGLDLTDEDLESILPQVKVGRDPLADVPEIPRNVDPAVQFRIPQ